ncbi:MAG TPA: helix-turn-helix domain-containing protein [Candidatus Paceibacterota bacterium]|nr:helix-turn-helix domain-containing protein [Candidatus Paceibacterota bacterium]
MKKDQIIIDGKIYISARRGAEIAGYSADYVGQLCRAGKIDCAMIGRSWYVGKESILKHQEEAFKANQTSFKSTEIKSPYSHVPVSAFPLLLTSPHGGSVSAIPRTMSEQVVQAAHQVVHDAHRATPRALIASLLVTAVVGAGALLVSPLFMSTSTVSFDESNSASVAQADSSSRAASLIKESLSAIYGASVKYTALGIDPSMSAVTDQSSNDADPYQELAYGGLVVTPSQGTTTDAKLANAITNSFSDPVEVRKNENTNTGVITPMFRTVKGHDFMYVLVPVQTTSSTSNNDSK